MFNFYSIFTLILKGLDSQINAKAQTILIKRHNHIIMYPSFLLLHKREHIDKTFTMYKLLSWTKQQNTVVRMMIFLPLQQHSLLLLILVDWGLAQSKEQGHRVLSPQSHRHSFPTYHQQIVYCATKRNEQKIIFKN